MSARRVATCLALAVAAVSCTATPPPAAPVANVRPDETVAPQQVGSSPVQVAVSPVRLRSGTLHVTTSARATGAWLTANHAWLDRETGGQWVTAWLLARGVSVSLEGYARGGVALTSDAVPVPSTLTFVLDPAPPAGRYRLRLEAGGGAPLSEGGSPPSWATATVEVLPA